MVYAITGSSGFIGTALVNRLIKDEHTVNPIRRWQMGSVEALNAFLEATGSETIIHLAAYGNHFGQIDHKEILRSNILYTLNVLKAAAGRKVYNFSTSSVYLKTKTLYSISKQTAEQIAETFPNSVTIHPYSVYGPGEASHRFIPIVCAALKNGDRITLDESATHDWIYVGDAIEAFLNGHTELGTGEKRTNLEVARKLEEVSGKKLNYAPGSLRNYDNSNWVAPVGVVHRSIEEGLLKTWNWYNQKQ